MAKTTKYTVIGRDGGEPVAAHCTNWAEAYRCAMTIVKGWRENGHKVTGNTGRGWTDSKTNDKIEIALVAASAEAETLTLAPAARPTMAARDVTIGDVVEFKCDVEQSSEVLGIQVNHDGLHSFVVNVNAGGYAHCRTLVDATSCWAVTRQGVRYDLI